MTPKTLRKERAERFRELICKSEIYMQCRLEMDALAAELEELVYALADAAASRSEVRGIEAAIFSGRPVTEEDMEEKTIREACNEFESALGFGGLPWDSTAGWTALRKFVVAIYQVDPQEFRKFEAWRKDAGKYQGATNKSIRENPAIFIDTHYPTYQAHGRMYKTDESRTTYTDEKGIPLT